MPRALGQRLIAGLAFGRFVRDSLRRQDIISISAYCVWLKSYCKRVLTRRQSQHTRRGSRMPLGAGVLLGSCTAAKCACQLFLHACRTARRYVAFEQKPDRHLVEPCVKGLEHPVLDDVGRWHNAELDLLAAHICAAVRDAYGAGRQPPKAIMRGGGGGAGGLGLSRCTALTFAVGRPALHRSAS